MSKVDGILCLDPAGVAASGIALRVTSRAVHSQSGRPRKPEWHWSGVLWGSSVQDDLALELFRLWPYDRPTLLFAYTKTAYQGTALSQGLAVGCIRGLLEALNINLSRPPVGVSDQTWRASTLPEKARKEVRAIQQQGRRRAAWKALAVETVLSRHRIECDDNAAEAILLSDYLVAERPDLWQDAGKP